MTPDNFEGVNEPRKTWCLNRMVELRKWVSSYGRYGSHAQIEAALERIAGLESLLNEQSHKHSDVPSNYSEMPPRNPPDEPSNTP